MKRLLKSLLAIMFLSLFTSSTLVFADEKEDVKFSEENMKFTVQKEDIDTIVENYSTPRALKELSKYKIDSEGLSSEEEKELIEYKLEKYDELNEKHNILFPIVAGVFSFIVVFILLSMRK